MKNLLLPALLALLLLGSAKLPIEYTVTITVTGLENTSGDVIVSLYNKDDGFPQEIKKSLQARKIPATSKSIVATFQVPVGVYAASVVHDENRNGDMDKNWLGIPTEAYCFTNNATGFMSPPSFSSASFVVKANVSQTIKLIY